MLIVVGSRFEGLRDRLTVSGMCCVVRPPRRYGAETVAPSPAAEIVNVPRTALIAKLYARPQIVLIGLGIVAMERPSAMFCGHVAVSVSRSSTIGSIRMSADQAQTHETLP